MAGSIPSACTAPHLSRSCAHLPWSDVRMRHLDIHIRSGVESILGPLPLTLPHPFQILAPGDAAPDGCVLEDGIDDGAEVFAASQVDEGGADADGFVGQRL